MKKLPLVLFSTALMLSSALPAFAEDTMMNTTTEPTAVSRPLLRPTVKAVRDEMKATVMTDRMELKDKIQAAREAAKETVAAQKAAFQTKLATLKDEKKKTIVTDVDTRIATVNQSATDEMAMNLTRLSSILDTISSKSAIAKSSGKNTTTLDADVLSARSALTLAQTAVTMQAAKTYTVQITTETALKTTVKTTLALFRKDIESTRKTVVTARDGVRVAALDFMKLNTVAVSLTPAPTASATAN